jgi:hypothetical protein
MFKRLAVIAVGALVAASFGVPAAAALTSTNPDGSFTMTVNKKAYTNHWKTVVTVSGMYTCSPSTDPSWTPTNIGLNVGLTQIQGTRFVVTGQGGMPGMGGEALVCNGLSQPWSVDVPANVSGDNEGTSATWKRGKVAANIGGNASDGGYCDESGCYGHNIGINFDTVLQIS